MAYWVGDGSWLGAIGGGRVDFSVSVASCVGDVTFTAGDRVVEIGGWSILSEGGAEGERERKGGKSEVGDKLRRRDL